MSWQIEQRNGLYLPAIDWFLDAHKPVAKSFVSHAHFDHMGDHRTILCSPPTAELIRQRLPGQRNWRIYDFGEVFELEPGIKASLHPAGHIIGSAMLRIEREGESLLYTGDFKLTPGISVEACQPVNADTLIIESTYGLPRYTFPPEKEVFEDILRFCQDTLENDETPVLFGYSLGKSQAILRSLADAKLEVMLHPAALKLTLSCQKLGWQFPPFYAFEPRNQKGKVIIAPPMAKSAPWLDSIHKPRTAMISGWAIDPTATYRYQCDKVFPLSDHADYLDLLSFVDKVGPREVYTVHGYAREFAATLRSQGYQAWALGKQNQLQLDIEADEPTKAEPPGPASEPEQPQPAAPEATFYSAALAHQELCSTDSLARKRELLNTLLSSLSSEEAAYSIQLLDHSNRSAAAEHPSAWVKQALAFATGTSEEALRKLARSEASSSRVAYQLLEPLGNAPSMSLAEVHSFLATLASAPNPMFKQSLLAECFKKLSPHEGAFLYAQLTRSSTAGLNEHLLCQAIADRFQKSHSAVQAAYLRCGELPAVCRAAADDRLGSIRIEFFKPIALIEPATEKSPEAVIEKQGLRLWSEQEHDGLRCQLHKNGEHAELYDTSGARISHLFPELLEASRLIPQHFIADAVVVPWGYEAPLPRAELQRRLQRRGEDLFLGEEVPVILWLIDLLCLNGDDLLDEPLEARRRKLDTFTVNSKIRITPVTTVTGAGQIEAALEQSSSSGCRGLVFKTEGSPYNPLNPRPDWLRLAGRQGIDAAGS